jgi:hypothetical protein
MDNTVRGMRSRQDNAQTGQDRPHHNNSNNQGSQGDLDNNTDNIPWLVYRGIGLEGHDEPTPAEEELLENAQWWEAQTGAENHEADYQASNRRRHIIRVDVEESMTAIPSLAFKNCTELREIRIPDTVTRIDNSAFASCESLEAIQVPRLLRHLSLNAFTLCSSLTSIWLPDSVETIGPLALSYCVVLHSVRLPVGLTSLELGILCGCTALTSLEIPGSVISIGPFAISGCTSLRAITISVSSNLWRVSREAFAQCPMLTEISVGQMAVALWPHLLRQLGSRTGLFGYRTGINSAQRGSFVLSFLSNHMTQFFGGPSNTARGQSTKRRTPARQN